MRHRNRLLFPTALTAAALALPVAAQSPPAADPPRPAAQLPQVTIEGRSIRADLADEHPSNPFRTPASSVQHTQVISREQIERMRPRDVFDVLDSATGVLAVQGSRKGFSGLSIRGDSNFRWILDGVVLQPTMAARILRALPVLSIEEVKIVRGGSALTLGPLVGSASPGGAPVDGFVVLRTRRPARDEARARLALESNQTAQLGLWGGGLWADVDSSRYLAGLLSRADTNGPDELLDNGVPYNVASTYEAALGKAGFSAGGWAVDLLAWRGQGEFQVPNANSHGPGQGSWYIDPSNTLLAAVGATRTWNSRHTSIAVASFGEAEQTFYTASTPAGPYASVQNDNRITQLSLRHHVELSSTRIAVGGEVVHWEAPNGQQYYEGIPREERTRSGFAQVEQRLLADRVTLDLALRRDRVHVLQGLDYYTGGAQPFGGVNSPLRYSDRTLPTARFLSAGASWALVPGWRVTARYGQGRQAAESLNPRPGLTLADDEQVKWELGLDGQSAGGLKGSLNFFNRDVKNEKSLSGYTYRAANGSTQVCRTAQIPATGALSPAAPAVLTPCYAQSDTRRAGFEVVVSGVLPAGGSWRSSLTEFTSRRNSAAATTPRRIAEGSADLPLGAWQLTAAVKHASSYRGSPTDAQAWLGGYVRYDAGIGRRFVLAGHPARASVYGRNLGDLRFETSNGVQDVGRVLGVELLLDL